MWVVPRLVGSLVRSGWKTLQQSQYFYLQQCQTFKRDSSGTREPVVTYRVITKGFPHYKLAEGEDLNKVQDTMNFLEEVVIPQVDGKKTSKKIKNWMFSWLNEIQKESPPNYGGQGILDDSSESEDSMRSEEEDMEYVLPKKESMMLRKRAISDTAVATALSALNNEKELMLHDLEEINEYPNEDKGGESGRGEERKGVENEGANKEEASTPFEHPPLMLSDEGTTETLPLFRAINDVGKWLATGASLEKTPGHPNASANSPSNLILQFLALLSYPDIHDQKGRLSFQTVREVSLVKQRRRVLLLMTLWTLVIRYCSLDMFILLVIASNCGLLILMKNSRKVNIALVKRGLKQRVTWAKTWAGGLFMRKGGGGTQQSSVPASSTISKEGGIPSPPKLSLESKKEPPSSSTKRINFKPQVTYGDLPSVSRHESTLQSHALRESGFLSDTQVFKDSHVKGIIQKTKEIDYATVSTAMTQSASKPSASKRGKISFFKSKNGTTTSTETHSTLISSVDTVVSMGDTVVLNETERSALPITTTGPYSKLKSLIRGGGASVATGTPISAPSILDIKGDCAEVSLTSRMDC